MEAERLVLTVDQTAKALGLSRPAAYQAVATGEIPSIKIGRRILIPRVALEKLLAEAGNNTTKERENGKL